MNPVSGAGVPERLLLSAEIRLEHDVVLVRQRARQLAALLEFDVQEQTRIATAVSEIARNAFQYAGHGRVEFGIVPDERLFVVRVLDSGPGIPNLDEVLSGRHVSATGMGLGIVGARRLTEQFSITTEPGRGTTVTLATPVPRRAPPLTPARLAEVARGLAAAPRDTLAELQAQNRDLLRTLQESQARQSEVERLNAELEETNRGVLALYAELDDRAVELARASEQKSRFVSNISHELRTPLNSILNITRLLVDRVDGDLTAEQERQVLMVRRSAAALVDIVNDLLDLARIEAGKSVVRLTPFAVDEMIGALRAVVRPLLSSEAVTFVVDPPPPGLTMHSDEGKVSQILRNLLSNAIKFTETGEIRLTVSRDGERVRFVVADTGIGIAPEDLQRIFEEFGQVENPLQRHVVGSGLGLPLSRHLAQLLRGSLDVTSALGRGSTFTLELPRTLEAYEPARPAPEHPDRAVARETSHA